MVNPVKSRLTHYESLGLTPAATPDEIAEAFAKQIGITITSSEDAVEHADKVYVAYETLRDPIRRSAYDAAIGLWDREAAAEQEREPFIGRKTRELPEREAHVDPAGGTPRSKTDQHGGRKTNKAAIEWPVPQAKTLDEQAATHVDAEALGGRPRRAKNERRRPGRAKKAQIDREARSRHIGVRKEGRRPPRRVKRRLIAKR